MSEPSERQRDNVDLAQRAYDAFSSGDTEGLLALSDPEIEIYTPPNLANSGSYRGHDGFLAWMGQWLEAWEHYELRILDSEPVGQRHVVSAMKQTAVGRGSGVPVEMDVAYLMEMRGGKRPPSTSTRPGTRRWPSPSGARRENPFRPKTEYSPGRLNRPFAQPAVTFWVAPP